MLLICSPGVVLEGLLNYQWKKSILFRQNAQSRQMNVFQLQVEQLSPDSAFVAKIKVITK